MRLFSRWLLHPAASLASLGLLFLLLPVASRYWLGWSDISGYVSDLAIGSLLLLLCYRRPLLTVPLALTWGLMLLGNAELINAVGRMPEPSDLKYLSDPQFVSHSTQGAGIRYPLLAIALGLALLACLLTGRKRWPALPRASYALPLVLLAGHATSQYFQPSEADQWKLFNLPHKLLAENVNKASIAAEDWYYGDDSATPPDIADLARLELNGQPLLPNGGKARNVLIITMEGILGAYIARNRQLLHSSYQ